MLLTHTIKEESASQTPYTQVWRVSVAASSSSVEVVAASPANGAVTDFPSTAAMAQMRLGLQVRLTPPSPPNQWGSVAGSKSSVAQIHCSESNQ